MKIEIKEKFITKLLLLFIMKGKEEFRQHPEESKPLTYKR